LYFGIVIDKKVGTLHSLGRISIPFLKSTNPANMKFTSHLPTAYSVYFGFLVQAQKNSSSSDSQCSKIIEDIGQGDVAFNATGTTTLSLLEQDDWHLSVTFQFRQARNTSIVNGLFYRGDRAVFLSVPESITETTVGNGIKLCYYEMDALNITSDSGESNDNDTGCGGVLSEECQKALRSAQGPRDEKCRPADVEEACGRIIRRWTSMYFPCQLPKTFHQKLKRVDISRQASHSISRSKTAN
jgi:hypothetical protein